MSHNLWVTANILVMTYVSLIMIHNINFLLNTFFHLQNPIQRLIYTSVEIPIQGIIITTRIFRIFNVFRNFAPCSCYIWSFLGYFQVENQYLWLFMIIHDYSGSYKMTQIIKVSFGALDCVLNISIIHENDEKTFWPIRNQLS